MAIEIVTEADSTHDKDLLEMNANNVIINALSEYDADYHETDLVDNILKTIHRKPQNDGLIDEMV